MNLYKAKQIMVQNISKICGANVKMTRNHKLADDRRLGKLCEDELVEKSYLSLLKHAKSVAYGQKQTAASSKKEVIVSGNPFILASDSFISIMELVYWGRSDTREPYTGGSIVPSFQMAPITLHMCRVHLALERRKELASMVSDDG